MLYIEHPLTYNNHSKVDLVIGKENDEILGISLATYLSFNNISFRNYSDTCPIEVG